MLSRRSFAASLALAASWRPRGAGAAFVPVDLRYAVEVAGVRIAEVGLSITPEGGVTRSRLAMRSQGLAAYWSDAWSRLTATSATDDAAPPDPRTFTAYQHKRDRVREIAIRYDRDGAIDALEVKSQGRPRESEVPPELRRSTVDPLTAFLRLQRWVADVAAGRGHRTVTLPVFDGRKRLDLEATYAGEVESGRGRAHAVDVRLTGLSGFEPDDWFVAVPGQGEPDLIRVEVSADARLVPLSIRSTSGTTSTVITLVTDCRDVTACADLVPGTP